MRSLAIDTRARESCGVVCVDLDGTLVIGDLLWESFVTLFKRQPLRALAALGSLRKGRAQFKRTIARLIAVEPASLVYREGLLHQLRQRYQQGHRLVLATASDEIYARAVASHLGIFAEVVASDGHTNLSGPRKAATLVRRYGHRCFAYLGNSWADAPVWRCAAEATAVAAPRDLIRYGRSRKFITHVHSVRPRRFLTVLRALRPHQWVKNLLVFVPVVAAHTVFRGDLLVAAACAFVVFCLSASAIYVFNDISDIQSDRAHPRKRKRPFAAGELTIPFGVALAAALLVGAIALAATTTSWRVVLLVVLYVIVTSAYSLRLKQQPVTDVFTLTGLYVLRIVAGSVATDTPLSSWLLAFALFLFLSLAFVKRFTELSKIDGWSAGRGYCRDDVAWMQSIGTNAGYIAVLVLALYVNAPETSALYARPRVLLSLCPLLLFWVTRLWFRAGRGVLLDDPVLEALTDRASYISAAAAIAIILAAV